MADAVPVVPTPGVIDHTEISGEIEQMVRQSRRHLTNALDQSFSVQCNDDAV